jgi:hypothetical protein
MDECILTMKDGIVTLNRIVPEKRVSLETLVQTAMQLDRRDYTCTPVLPGSEGACRVFAENSKAIGFLLQCGPTVRTIRYATRRGRGQPEGKRRVDSEYEGSGTAYLFDLSFPWVWVFCKLFKVDRTTYDWRRCFLCATYDNIETLNDRIYVAPVPNQWGGTCLMCTGDVAKEGNATDKPALMCRKFLYRLWDGYFNDDLTPDMPSALDDQTPLINKLEAWEDMTRSNPGIGLSRDFGLKTPKNVGRLGEFVSMAMGGDYDDAR